MNFLYIAKSYLYSARQTIPEIGLDAGTLLEITLPFVFLREALHISADGASVV
jgi:hypothetical protein